MDNKDYLYALNRMKKMAEEYAKNHPNYEAAEDINVLTKAISLLEAEGEGRMVELSCKISDTAYVITDCANVLKDRDDDYITGTGTISCPFESQCEFDECDDAHKRIFDTVVRGIWIDEDGLINYFFDKIVDCQFYQSDFGKTVFLNEAEAAEKLKEQN